MAHNITNIADRIIVEGGSTEGSLALESLQEKGECELLLKTGPCKLGAQLRCAYTFAVDHGDEGFVTIDVNDNDGPEAIIRFTRSQMMSLFSGFTWTDTTQGVCTYSRNMLADVRIDIFREVFKTYELLVYFLYFAPKLGYRCLELNNIRRYPQGEVPTKISGFMGNLKVLKVLIHACFGSYNSTRFK